MERMYNVYSDIKQAQMLGDRLKKDVVGTSNVNEGTNFGKTEKTGTSDVQGTSDLIGSAGLGGKTHTSGATNPSSILGGTTGIGDLIRIGSTGLGDNPENNAHSEGFTGTLSGLGQSASNILVRTQGVFTTVERNIEDLGKIIGGPSKLSQGSSGRNL